VGELGALKARYERADGALKTTGQSRDLGGGGGILPQSAWLGFAVILALAAAISLTLSYRELRRLEERKQAFALKEQSLAECDQRISALNSNIAKMEAKSEQLKAEVMALEGDAVKGAEVAAATAAYKTYMTTLPGLKKETEDLSARAEALRGEQSSLDGAVAKAQARLGTVLSAKTNAQAKLDQLESNLTLRNANIADWQAAIASNKVSLTACAQAIKEAKAEHTIIKNDCDSKRKEKDDQVRELNEARAAMSGLQDAVTRLRSEHMTVTNELAQMTIELARVSSRISAERKGLADLEAEKTRLNDEVARLTATKAEYDALAQKKDDAGRQLASLGQQVESQKALLAGRTAEAGELNKQVDILEAKRLELERAVSQLIGQQSVLDSKDKTSNRK